MAALIWTQNRFWKKNDVEQVNLNSAKSAHYAALDQAFDTLIPGAKELNASYASKIQLEKLLEKQISAGKNADMLSRARLPEAVFKTNLMKLLDYGKPATAAAAQGAGTFEFYGAPKPKSPYEQLTSGRPAAPNRTASSVSSGTGSLGHLSSAPAKASGYDALLSNQGGKGTPPASVTSTGVPESLTPKAPVAQKQPTGYEDYLQSQLASRPSNINPESKNPVTAVPESLAPKVVKEKTGYDTLVQQPVKNSKAPTGTGKNPASSVPDSLAPKSPRVQTGHETLQEGLAKKPKK